MKFLLWAGNSYGTTRACATCGVTIDKPLWVRKHSCPACGFEVN
ncbi:zinc ribbon domain-containing protein [Haladaptatus sp. NG-SE-30]